MWRELRRFGDSSGVASEVWNRIQLADGYLRAYEDADELIDPVMLYYGSMWLAAALIHSVLLPADARAGSQAPWRDTRWRLEPSICADKYQDNQRCGRRALPRVGRRRPSRRYNSDN